MAMDGLAKQLLWSSLASSRLRVCLSSQQADRFCQDLQCWCGEEEEEEGLQENRCKWRRFVDDEAVGSAAQMPEVALKHHSPFCYLFQRQPHVPIIEPLRLAYGNETQPKSECTPVTTVQLVISLLMIMTSEHQKVIVDNKQPLLKLVDWQNKIPNSL